MSVPRILIFALLGVAIDGQAYAARNVEVVRQPSLLMFGEVNQLLGVSSSFTEHASQHSSSSTSSLAERYSLSTIAAVLDEDLATIQMQFGVSYQQSFADKTSTFLNGQYNIVTSAFGASTHPVTIIATRDTSMIDNGFTPAYTLTRNTTQLSASLLHDVLPLQVSFGHSTSDSSGLSQDFSSTTNAVSLNTTHNWQDISTSLVALDFSSADSKGEHTSAYSLYFDNGLNFDQQRRFVLNSKVQRQDSKSSVVPQRTFTLSEALTCRLGQALLGTMTYDFSDSSTVDFENKAQSVQTNTVSASLGHRLYASLATGINVAYSKSEAFGGTSTGYSGNVNFNYFKLLPRQSSLALLGSFSRKITDQSEPISRINIANELTAATTQGGFLVPGQAGTLISVASVRSLQSDNPTIPDTTYLPGTDYAVDFTLGRIVILVGGSIPNGTILRISYTVDVNPSIKFQSDTYNTGFVLTLASGTYTLGGDMSVLSESLLSGEAKNVPLARSTSYHLRADARYSKSSLGVDYAYSDSNSQQFSKIGAHYNYATQLSRTESFNFNARNDLTIYPARNGNTGYTENSLSTSASYGCLFFDLVRSSLALGANDSRSRFGSGQSMSGKWSLDADYRRLSLSLSALTNYRINGSAANRDSNITLTVTRSF